jgi:hypothetical protein
MHRGIVTTCAVLLAVFCGFEIYHQTGMVHATKKNGYGCLCHGFDPSATVRVWIAGPDSLQAGTEATYTVSIAKQGFISAGFDVAAYRGSLGIVDSVGTQLLTESPGIDSLELTHVQPRMANGRDTISWLFKYKAPLTVGWIDTIYAAGIAANRDTTPDGDFWNHANNFLVRVIGPTSVEHAQTRKGYRLLQNYPNPFNPSTTIQYEIPVGGQVELKVFDVSGKEIGTLVNGEQSAGNHSVVFDVQRFRSIASGVYLYRISVTAARNISSQVYVAAKKMLLVK